MNRKIREYSFPGTTKEEIQDYELRHAAVARQAAAEGMVLLKNAGNLLPLPKSSRIALYGAAALQTIKGGTGSGDVNCRRIVNIYEGLKEAGYKIVNENWISDYHAYYKKAREEWRKQIWEEIDERKKQGIANPMFSVYTSKQFDLPAGPMPEKTEADMAIYCIARIAGEAKDREYREGDYLLSEEENMQLRAICDMYDHVLVIINSGGLIDLSFVDELPQIQSVLFIGQPGMEAGHAAADIISGDVTPSGKLADSWAVNYEDYPNAKTFSHMNGDTSKEYYTEGIYVGYRYFDTYEVPVRYSFGYGLSYTDFEIRLTGFELEKSETQEPSVHLRFEVANMGEKYSGREVVQVYVSCSQEGLPKEYRRLAGFAKTGTILPGEKETVDINVPLALLTSYSEAESGWILSKGKYGFFAGNSLASSALVGALDIENQSVMIKTEPICRLQEELEELQGPSQKRIEERRSEWIAQLHAYPMISIFGQLSAKPRTVEYGNEKSRIPDEVWSVVNRLDREQLIQLVTGNPSKGQGALGAAGDSIPGSAAQTSGCAVEEGIASIVLADGPAGLRLAKDYYVEDGKAIQMPIEASLEGGCLYRGELQTEGELWHQYCTAFPVGMLLAQSWDEELMRKVGAVVAEELELFHITLWLAPGMNIHRNPLCGRNFEYYSEDPLLSGKLAAAITRGVQENGHAGTTIKHFACNNQEDNRLRSDSIVSERALREIYLKGFEYAVKESQPFGIMTSYNLINGIHAANHRDLCSKVARDEWGFSGVIMTDWTTTHYGADCTASGCMRAGNDLVMPGRLEDHENMKQELEQGTLTLEQIKLAVAHLLSIVWKSDAYEG